MKGTANKLMIVAGCWIALGIMAIGAGDRIWMAIGFILAQITYLAALIIQRIDGIDDRDQIRIGEITMPASRAFDPKPKKDLA